MRVSILLPAYNAELYLKETLDSILAQTFKDFEVLLIDDGSTDATSSIAIEYSYKDPRIKYHRNKQNIGLIRTLNKGLSLASGEYIVRMDSDDIMVSDRIEKQVKYMDIHPTCIVCGGQMKFIGDKNGDAPLLPLTHEDLYKMYLINCPLYHPTVIIRNQTLQKLGLKYNESYKHAEDYKFWSDIINLFPNSIANIKDIVLHYRVSGNQISTKFRREQELLSKKIRRENVQHILSNTYGVYLPKEINKDIIRTVSSLIKKEKKQNRPILILILCMLYISIANPYNRIKLYLSSRDFFLFFGSFSYFKLGLSILFSICFSNRGKQFMI